MGFILIYVTHKNVTNAKKIVKHLLSKKLIACANIFTIKSMYTWKNKLCDENEVVTILKTVSKNYKKVESAIKKIHPYDCPCIMKIPVSANKEFEDWISSSVK